MRRTCGESRPQGWSEGLKARPFERGCVRVQPSSGRPAGFDRAAPIVCMYCVCVRTSRNPVKDVFVYMSERVQPVIAACSYFLKHNGAGAVIIFGLEWLINF